MMRHAPMSGQAPGNPHPALVAMAVVVLRRRRQGAGPEAGRARADRGVAAACLQDTHLGSDAVVDGLPGRQWPGIVTGHTNLTPSRGHLRWLPGDEGKRLRLAWHARCPAASSRSWPANAIFLIAGCQARHIVAHMAHGR